MCGGRGEGGLASGSLDSVLPSSARWRGPGRRYVGKLPFTPLWARCQRGNQRGLHGLRGVALKDSGPPASHAVYLQAEATCLPLPLPRQGSSARPPDPLARDLEDSCVPASRLSSAPGPKPLKQQPLWAPLQCDRALQVAPRLPSGGQDGGGSAAASGLPLRLQQVNKGSTVPSASLFRGAAAPGGSALDGPHGACAGPGSLRCERGRPTGSDRNVTDRVPSGVFLSAGFLTVWNDCVRTYTRVRGTRMFPARVNCARVCRRRGLWVPAGCGCAGTCVWTACRQYPGRRSASPGLVSVRAWGAWGRASQVLGAWDCGSRESPLTALSGSGPRASTGGHTGVRSGVSASPRPRLSCGHRIRGACCRNATATVAEGCGRWPHSG